MCLWAFAHQGAEPCSTDALARNGHPTLKFEYSVVRINKGRMGSRSLFLILYPAVSQVALLSLVSLTASFLSFPGVL